MRFSCFSAILILFTLSLVLSGCEIINPEEETPTYLRINKILLDPKIDPSGSYGSASSKISDVWLYANGKEIGVFELPATIPILEKGDVRLDIIPGVYIDGLKGNRVQYPFYEQKAITVAMEPGKVTTIDPTVTFKNTIDYPLNVYEDFTGFTEGDKTEIRLAPGGPYNLVPNTDTLTDFEYAAGSVGVVYGIPGKTEHIFLESAFNGNIKANNGPVYLEFDYKATMNFEVGVAVNLPNQPGAETRDKEIIVGKSNKWNRIYIELTNEVNKPQYISGAYQIILEGLPSGAANEYIAIDNVRLLHNK